MGSCVLPRGSRRFDGVFEGASSLWSCCVRDAESGDVLYRFNDGSALIPASNQKLPVLCAALLELGPDYRMQTWVLAKGRIKDGVLQGDLVFQGNGAVHFTARYPVEADVDDRNRRLNGQLDQLAARLREAGIGRITGSIVADHGDWPQANPHYPAAAGFSFHENTVDVHVVDGTCATTPFPLLGFRVEPELWDGTQGKRQSDGRTTDRIRVNPGLDSRDYWRMDTLAPAEYYLQNIRQALAARDIACGGGQPCSAPAIPLFPLQGLSVAALVQEMGIHSDNMRAELLFLELGRHRLGKTGYAIAAAALPQILAEKGIALPSWVAHDGSGLSRENRISANDLSRLLHHMARSPYSELLKSSLAVSGVSGTLMTKLTASQGRVHAKTGALSDVRALSGFVTTDSGRELVFSLICNQADDQAWPTMEAVMQRLVNDD